MKSYLKTEIGVIEIIEENGSIISIAGTDEEGEEDSSPLLSSAKKELSEYFRGERKTFDLPLCPSGTDFQKSVWKALLSIPYGDTRTYSEIAEEAGRKDAVRAAANAVGSNPIPIIIPCHRVIRKDGSLGGFSMKGGIETKKILLGIEEKNRS